MHLSSIKQFDKMSFNTYISYLDNDLITRIAQSLSNYPKIQ